jgi:hypothetical protein
MIRISCINVAPVFLDRYMRETTNYLSGKTLLAGAVLKWMPMMQRRGRIYLFKKGQLTHGYAIYAISKII